MTRNAAAIRFANILEIFGRIMPWSVKGDATSAACKKKHKEVAQLYHTVIMKAERRNHNLRCILKSGPIYSHILDVFYKVEKSSPFIEIYTNILLKCMLVKHKHVCQLGVTKWHEYLVYYFTFLLETRKERSKGGSQIPHARVVQQLLALTHKMPYVHTDEVYTFFDNILKNSRQEKNHLFLELMLSGLVSFASATVLDTRIQFCQLGENYFGTFVQLWKYQVPGMKLQLLQFFQLQIIAHFCSDGKFVLEKAYLWHNETWKNCLKDMLELVYLEFLHLREKISRDIASRKSLFQKKVMIKFVAYLIHQIQIYSPDQLDISISCTLSSSLHKKSRVTIGSAWEFLIEGLQDTSEPDVCLTWLEIVEYFFIDSHIHKSKDDCLQLIKILVYMLPDNHHDISSAAVRTLHRALNYICSQGVNTAELNDIVNACWRSSLKLVDVTQEKDDLFQLLCLCWGSGLVANPGTDLYGLFKSDGCSRSLQSMLLLQGIIMVCNFPHSAHSNSAQKASLDEDKARRQFLEWLLPSHNGVSEPIITRQSHSVNSVEEIGLLCALMASLICVAPSSSLQNMISLRRTDKTGDKTYLQLQEDFLINMYGNNDVRNKVGSASLGPVSQLSHLKCTCLQEAELFLLKKIELLVGQLLCSNDKCLEVSTTELFVFVAILREKVLQHTNSETLAMSLHDFSKQLLEKLGSLIGEMVGSDIEISSKTRSLSLCLKYLNGFVSLHSSIDIGEYISDAFIELLIHVVDGEFSTSVLALTQHRNMEQMNSSSIDDFMELDTPFGDNELSKCTDVADVGSPADVNNLNDIEKVNLAVFQVLLTLILSNQNKYESQRIRLFTVMENLKQDGAKLHILISLYSIINKNDFKPLGEVLMTIDSVRQFLSSHRFDMDVCAAFLEGICCYIDYLSATSFGEFTEEREIVLKLVEVFWSLRSEKYSPAVRIKLIDALEALSCVRNAEADWKIAGTFAPELLVQLLNDSSLIVRLEAALRIHIIFTGDSACNQYQVFDCLSTSLTELVNNNEDLNRLTAADVSLGKEVTLLVACKMVICASPVLHSRGISSLLDFARVDAVNSQHVYEVLQETAIILGYEDVAKLVSPYILYVLMLYLTKSNSINTFPTTCLGLGMADFLKTHYRVMVSYYALTNNYEGVGELVALLGYEDYTTTDLLMNSFVLTLVMTLPEYCEYINSGGEQDERRKQRMDGFKALRQHMGEKAYNQQLDQQFDEIVLQLILRIDDQPDAGLLLSSYTLPTDASSFYPKYTSSQVSLCFSHLAAAYGVSTTTIGSFLKYAERIPTILAQLAVHVSTTQLETDKLSGMRSYFFFANFLLDNLHHLEHHGGNWIVREITYRMLYFLESSTEASSDYRITNMCFQILDTLFERIDEFVSIELSCYLYFVVNKIVQFVEVETMSAQALKLLHHLITEATQEDKDFFEYVTAVSLLDELPHTPKFTKLNDRLLAIRRSSPVKTIDEELKRISRNLLQFSYKVPISILEYLKKFLRNTSDVVASAESYKDIVACLLRICNQGYDEESALLAVDCLGLIGPLPIPALSDGGGWRKAGELPYHLFHHYPLKFHVVVESVLHLCVHRCAFISNTAWECLLRLIKWNKANQIVDTFKDELGEKYVYIQPFFEAKRTKMVKEIDIKSRSNEKFSNFLLYDQVSSLDWPMPAEKWLCNLVSSFLTLPVVDKEYFIVFEPLCRVNADFARVYFPFVVHNILCSDGENKRSLNIAYTGWLTSFLAATEYKQKACFMKEKMIEIVHLVTSLRNIYMVDEKNMGDKKWVSNFWLESSYMKLAKAAFQCGLYYNAALFIEIASDLLLNKNVALSHNDSKSDQLCSSNFQCASNEASALLYHIYSNIGDLDAIYGIDANASVQVAKRLQVYQCEKSMHKALLLSDLSCSTLKCNAEVLDTLMKSQLYHTTLLYLQSLSENEINDYSEIQFEAAWRNGVWDTRQLRHQLMYRTGFHSSIYQSLASFSQEEDLYKKHVRNAKLKVLDCMQHESNSTKSLYGILSKCFAVSMLESVGMCIKDGTFDDIKCPSTVSNDFSYYEPALSISSQVINAACIQASNSAGDRQVLEKLIKHITNYSKVARESQRYDVAEKFICMLSALNDVTVVDITPEWRLEEAKVYWDRKETNHAMQLLRELMNKLKTDGDGSQHSHLHPVVLGLFGHWLGETKSEYPVQIMDNYLEPAITAMESDATFHFHSPIDAYHSLAKYADGQYQSISEFIKSPMFERKQAMIKANREVVNKFNNEGKHKSAERSVLQHFQSLTKQCAEDEIELQQALSDEKVFREKAIVNYCRCLQHGEKYDLKILRLCSLWFEHACEEDINNKVNDLFPKIKSSKFLPVMYQLAARIGTNKALQSSQFREILEEVIKRCCLDHPHHSIFILLALCNADYEEKLNAKSKKRQSKNPVAATENADQIRINAAKSVLQMVKRSKASFVQEAESLANAYIDFAYWDITHLKNEKGSFMIPDSHLIRKINNFASIAIPTVEVHVDPAGEYKDVVHITKFDTSFSHAGGVNLPKIIDCVGSDGEIYKQLVKGRDDLRQDAVMQQVFGVVNLLLKSDSETRRRELHMRTYRIVPLSRNSGLMEWCQGTIPLGSYLIGDRNGSPGAHTRYYPKDWSNRDCRIRLTQATLTDGRKSKYNIFKEIQKNFHPVLRHFFYEKFRDPAVWFARRLNYTRSTAVSSIIGYIVGLGDRHVHNILIDCNNADMVHIDLGVAFEKGKLLPTPETIPFRLTRDIIDGMGIHGVNGVFRRCCEKTMGVMRNSHEAITTIVEVLLYDPLSDWTISSDKFRKAQKGRNSENDAMCSDKSIPNSGSGPGVSNSLEMDTDRNKMAERVLIRLKQKLEGCEGGPYLSVEGHVNLLMQEACSQNNLCRLFPGWQPWV